MSGSSGRSTWGRTRICWSARASKHAPWFVIPADHKWYRNLAISEMLVEALGGLELKYPEPTVEVGKLKL